MHARDILASAPNDAVPPSTKADATEPVPPLIQPQQPNGNSPSPSPSPPPAFTPIAICGLATRLPGGIRSPADLWSLIVSKRSGRSRVPESRYTVSNWLAPEAEPGAERVKIGHVGSGFGYFLDDVDLRDADTSFWAGTISASEFEAMDPQQRLLLEVVFECLGSAGVKVGELRGGTGKAEAAGEGRREEKVGVFIGSFGDDWGELNSRDDQAYHMYRLMGQGAYMLANRVSYAFGFSGPSITTQTACSSSLTALHTACQSLLSGDCTSAIVAAANLIFSPRACVIMHEQGIISPTGSCKSFDAAADGYARGEAVSAIYVKKLEDAIRDGDPVRSVIRAACVNSATVPTSAFISSGASGGGKTASITTPSAEAQEALMRRGLEIAGVTNPASVAMIECHGTGTQVGDPIETTAVGNVFGEQGIYIGSVKSNLGHSEGASGLTSIIKMTLALERRVIPPNINFTTPNPRIPFERCKLKVPTEPLSWPTGRAELIGINSFGIGGSNAHILLSSAASFGLESATSTGSAKQGKEQETTITTLTPHLLLFSAAHPKPLDQMLRAHQAYFFAHPDSLRNMAYSLAVKREMLSHRCFCVTDGENEWVASRVKRIPAGASSREKGIVGAPEVVFIFTGQGAQWPQMGRALIKQVPRFKEMIKGLDCVLQRLPDPPRWRILDELLAPKRKSRLATAELAQPCTTAIQLALVDLLSYYGVRPTAVIGHSSGEIAAAYAARAISAADAITIAFYRGRVVSADQEECPAGGMAAVGLGVEAVTPFLSEDEGARVGCENSPESTTLTGDREVLERVLERVQSQWLGVFVRRLNVDRAYHSHHMEPLAQGYIDLLTDAGVRAGGPASSVKFFSSVAGSLLETSQSLGPSYWAENLTSPVLFSTAMSALIQSLAGPKVLLELGPHSALSSPIRQILQYHKILTSPSLSVPATAVASAANTYIPTLTRNSNSHRDLLTALGELWLHDLPLTLYPRSTSTSTSREPHSSQPQHQEQKEEACRFLFDLPPYPWHYAQGSPTAAHRKLWSESRLSHAWRFRPFAHHELLGSRVLETTDENPAWRNILRAESVPWVKEHVVLGEVVVPAVGFVGLLGEAIRQVRVTAQSGKGTREQGKEGAGFTVRGMHIHAALVLAQSEDVEIVTQLQRQRVPGSTEEDWYIFTIHSYQQRAGTRNGNGKSKGSWVKHVSGRVSASPSASASAATSGSVSASSTTPFSPLPRVLSRRAWYRKLREMGLEYGARFRGLTDMTAHPVEHRLVATVVDTTTTPDSDAKGECHSPYAIHPAQLDCLIQAIIPASFNGLTRRFTSLALPTFIEEISISTSSSTSAPPARELLIEARIDSDGTTPPQRIITALTASGDLAMRITGLQLSPVSMGIGGESAGTDPFPYGPHAAVELEWREDINLVSDPGTLIRAVKFEDDRDRVYSLMDRLGASCILTTAGLLDDVETGETAQPQPHLVHFKKWITANAEHIRHGTYPGIEADDAIVRADPTELAALIEDLYDTLNTIPGAAAPVTAIHRIWHATPLILTGATDPLDLLTTTTDNDDDNDNNLLHALNDFAHSHTDYTALLTLLAHAKPNLRILEINGGTGSTTARALTALQALARPSGERMYGSYTFTDTSARSVAGAKTRFGGVFPAMEFRVLDIGRKLGEHQGFDEGEGEVFDFVIAGNLLNATPSLQTSLMNIRKLLNPVHGRLLLQELLPVPHAATWLNYIMGVLPGWYPELDIGVDQWERHLKHAGFGGGIVCRVDGDFGCNILVGVVDADAMAGEERRGRVTVLHSGSGCSEGGNGISTAATLVGELLGQAGVQVDFYALDSVSKLAPPAGQDTVSVLDLEAPFFHDLTESSFEDFKTLLSHLQKHDQNNNNNTNTNSKSSGILWLTGASQIACTDPRYGMVHGVARVVRTELSIDFATLELEDLEVGTLAFVPKVLKEIQRRTSSSSLDASEVKGDMEWAVVGGKALIGRYHFIRVAEELKGPRERNKDTVKKVEQGTPVRVDSLRWKEAPDSATQALGETEVLVKVKAVGLNHKEVLITTAASSAHAGRSLGSEASGLVLAVGSAVHALAVGDRVLMACRGCLSTTLQVDQRLCVRMPQSLSYEDGATIAVAYCTAIHCLLDVGRLRMGQSVLVHAAGGPAYIAVAALYIASIVGADIFATAASDDETTFLTETFNIPAHRIFSSCTAEFLPAIMNATNGVGVDLVLHPLSAELLHASRKCTAEFGTFIDISPKSSVGRNQDLLAMQSFGLNRSFVDVDILRLIEKRPERVQDLLSRAVGYYDAGLIQPIKRIATFPANSVADAIRHMERGLQQQHMDKVVITMPKHSSSLLTELSRRELRLRPDRAYLFVGGLGGIGRAVSVWLAEHGARHLIFLSPSAGSLPSDDPFLQELAALGCTATLAPGSVTDLSTVHAAILSSSGPNRPIAGVLQASMVLRDASLLDMPYTSWTASVAPKVTGTWNLHHALRTLQPTEELDFFFLFSSISAAGGQWGQANYNAGNTFLDAFTAYRRHALGLPAATVNVGVMRDVGYLSQSGNAELLDSLSATGQWLNCEADLLDSIELMLHRDRDRDREEASSSVGEGGKKEEDDGSISTLQSNPEAISSGDGNNSNNQVRYINRSQIVMGMRATQPMASPGNRTIWRRDPRMLVYRNLEDHQNEDSSATSGPGSGAAGSSEESLARFLRELSSNISVLKAPSTGEALALVIARTLFAFSGRTTASGQHQGSADESGGGTPSSTSDNSDIDIDQPLASAGLIDSLVSMELRNWIRRRIGVEISVLEIVQAESVRELGVVAQRRLVERYEPCL